MAWVFLSSVSAKMFGFLIIFGIFFKRQGLTTRPFMKGLYVLCCSVVFSLWHF